MLIREVKAGDGAGLVELFTVLDTETRFMLLEPWERNTSAAEQEQHIQDFMSSSCKTMLVVENDDNGEIAGFIVGIGGQFSRNRHSLHCVIGLKQKYTGQGLGRRAMKQLENWARGNDMHRLELTVMRYNERAIKLYKACGFEVEGVKRDSLNVNGQYIDELYMARIL